VSEAFTCTVIIVGYDGERWLDSCLSSLRASTTQPLRIVLVDNGGNGRIDRLPLSEFESVVLPTPRRMGFAEANNFGLVNAGLTTDAICFLNQDTISESGWLDECLKCLFEAPANGGVSPLVTKFDGAAWDEGFVACARRSSEFQQDAPRSQLPRFFGTPEVTAAAFVMRSDVLSSVGPFDPIFGSYYEDYDLCWRIRKAGYNLGICGRALIRHFGGSGTTTPERERKRMRQIARNRAIRRIRDAGGRRMGAILHELLLNFPRNFARGIVRTASSQPVGVHWEALKDLWAIAPRLVSEHRDSEEWGAYLREIGWPPATSGSCEELPRRGGVSSQLAAGAP
jgi:N-acetylglucosaminyl-diphospho-decaprenol L-rhamnosyltransferase